MEKLHEERNMLLETIEDLKQTVEQTAATVPEADTKVTNSATGRAEAGKQMWWREQMTRSNQ